jgi:crossover junction endodeoxyribonuclease RuvC
VRVLGVDPGYDRLGLAVVDGDGRGGGRWVWSTTAKTDRSRAHHERLLQVREAIAAAPADPRPDAVAIEKLFWSKSQTTAFPVAEARGVALAEAAASGCQVFEYSPNEVKLAVGGSGSAEKKSVEKMARLLAGIGSQKMGDDEADAVAIALTCLARERFPRA